MASQCLFSLFAVENNQIAGTLYILRLPTYPVLETLKQTEMERDLVRQQWRQSSIIFDMDTPDSLTKINWLK